MSDIKGLREISNDPFGKLLTSLSKKFSAFLAKDQAELVENPEDVYADGQDVESALKYHSFVMRKQFDLVTQYYSPSEPDYDKLRLWLKGNAIAVQLKDWSELEKAAFLYGDPILVDGFPFDYGIADGGAEDTKSIALRMNRPTSPLVNREYIQITDAASLQVAGITVGISYFIRFKISDLAEEGGYDRTIFEKIDGSTIQDAAMLTVTPSGNLVFTVRRTGTDYTWQTASGTIAIDTVYDVWCTFAQSGSVSHIYVNNVDKSLSATSTPTWQSETDNHDLWLFQRGKGPEAGFFYGDFYDFMLFREKVVSALEISHHYANKWTLADIPFGQVAISNYSATMQEVLTRISKSQTYKWNIIHVPSVPSFSATSFTGTSFTQ